ncbi:MAG: hypothetical protein ABFC94_00175 [Syntrophomonas sp.]
MDEYQESYLRKYIHESREQRSELRAELLRNTKQELPQLRELLDKINDEWTYEQLVYRYYYGSFKVYQAQEYTLEIVNAIHRLLPGRDLSPGFYNLIKKGTNKKFEMSVNERWEEEALPILNAFLHLRHVLEMLIKYGSELEEPEALPFGWATIMLLYGLR